MRDRLPATTLEHPDAREVTALWRPERDETPVSRRERLVLLALLVLAAGLRLVGLQQDLWLDEVFTLVDFVRLPLGQLLTDYTSDNQHLLYSLTAHLSIALLGESATALRLPAVLFGLGSLWSIWRLGRLLAGPREALLAVALLTVSYHHVWFSQNARGYTGLLFATVLATDLLLRALQHGRWRRWIAYAAVVALGMGVHLTMIFVVAAHGLVVLGLLLRAGRRAAGRARPLLAFLIAGLLTLLLYAPLLPQLLAFYLHASDATTTAAMVWKSPLWLVNEAIRGLGVGLAFGWLGLLGAALLLGSGAASYLRRTPAATLLFVLPALLGGGALLLLGRNLWPRFFFHEMAFAVLFAIRGAHLLGAGIGHLHPLLARLRPATVLTLALLLASALTLPRNYRLPKQDFSGARDFVLAARQPGDAIVAVDLAGEVYRRYYAAGRQDFAYAASLEELEARRAAAGRTWVLYTLGSYIEASQPDLWQVLQRDFEVVRTFYGTLGNGAIVVLRSRRANAAIPAAQ